MPSSRSARSSSKVRVPPRHAQSPLRNLSSRRIAPRGARARRALPSRSRPTPVSSPRLTFCASLAPSPSSISPDEAAKLFAARDPKKAAAAYEQGSRSMAPNDPDAAALHRNRAACFLHMRQYADVVAESTRALKISPKYTKALVYRGRAYNATGQTKKAKADSAAAIACDASSEEAKAFAADLEPKKQVQGLGGLGLAPAKKGEKRSKEEIAAAEALKQRELARQAQMMRERERQRQWGPPVTVKARCGEDVRTMIVPSMIAHKDLMTALQRKFPDLSAFTVAIHGCLRHAAAAQRSRRLRGGARGGERGGRGCLQTHPTRHSLREAHALRARAPRRGGGGDGGGCGWGDGEG